MTVPLKIMQHNLNKNRYASLQLRDYCSRNNVDIVLLQEMITQSGRVYGFEDCRQSTNGNAAGAEIIFVNDRLRVLSLGSCSSDFVVVDKISLGTDAEAITLVSIYFKYSMPTPCFIEKLRSILVCETV